jgi:nitrile hydratase beta subunit
MNGAHDLGGMMGFGAVEAEKDEPVFHARWEKRMMAMNIATGAAGAWNIDMGRHAREDRNPREYLDSSYYRLWYLGLARLLVERGLVGADELAAGRMLHPGEKIARVLAPGQVAAAMGRRNPYGRAPSTEARFNVGSKVRTREMHPAGHTRLPRYARGKLGTVAIVHGVHVFPDSHAHGNGEQPHWLYCVSFAAPELWGSDADPTAVVSTDCWEPYLEPA